MQIISIKHFYVFIILISFSLDAQEKKDWYSYFGEIPNTVDKHYYQDLKAAKTLLVGGGGSSSGLGNLSRFISYKLDILASVVSFQERTCVYSSIILLTSILID